MKFSSANFFQIFFLGSEFHSEIHWKKLFFYILKIPTKFGVVPQSFFEIKIPFKIRIRIMILLWILIPDLHFIHRRHPPNFVWIR